MPFPDLREMAGLESFDLIEIKSDGDGGLTRAAGKASLDASF